MAYLTGWRLQLGAQMLKSSSRCVAEVAAEVGDGAALLVDAGLLAKSTQVSKVVDLSFLKMAQ